MSSPRADRADPRVLAAAIVCLLAVIAMAWLRPRLTAKPVALTPTRGGVALLAVSHWSAATLHDADAYPNIAALAARGPVGIVPTRSGASGDDTDTALQMLLAGSRSPDPDGLTLPHAITGAWKTVPAASSEILREAAEAPTGSVLLVSIDAAESPGDFDRLVGSLTANSGGLPANWSLLAVGVSPTWVEAARRVQAVPVLLWQRDATYPTPTLLTSPSVRNQPGLAAATDVGATVAALLDLPRRQQRIGDGRAMEAIALPAGAGQAPALYLGRHVEAWGMQAREQHLLPGLPWTLAGILIVAAFAPWRPVRHGLTAAALIAPLAVVTVPLLMPIGLAISFPAWTVYVLAAAPTILVGLVAATNEKLDKQLPRLLAIATALTIAGDTLLGGPLLARTPLSYSVLEAARFYGIGNEVSGILLGAAVIAVGTEAGIAGAIFGIALAIVSAAPVFGADAGGFIATLIAFSTLVLFGGKRSTGSRKTILAAAVAACCILAAVAAFALWDAGRGPAQRTHIGEAVAAAKENGVSAITTIVARKLAVNARLSVTSPWAALFATEVGLTAWIYHRRKKRTPGREYVPAPGPTAALLAAALALYALNDSGVVAAATCGLWAFALRSEDPA